MKLLSLGLIIFTFCSFGAPAILAQDLLKECSEIYEEYKVNRKGPEYDKYKKAIEVGKKYLKKCRDLDKTITDYVEKDIPKLEIPRDPPNPIFERFNTSIIQKNWDESFLNGKEIINKIIPSYIDLSLVLASIGYDLASAYRSNDKYNDEAISYAKMALELMKKGQASESGDWGAYSWTYKTKECPNGKANAKGWMNYTIGYIMFVRQNQKELALPYLYQSTQIGCETLKNPYIYDLIGGWYLSKAKLHNSEIALAPEQKKYVELALDAYARAYNVNHGIHIRQKYLKKARDVFKILNESRIVGFESFLNEVMKTPFANPSDFITANTQND